MTDTEKKSRKKRSQEEIAAEKWSGPKHALEIVRAASKALEEAQAACAGKMDAPFERCQEVLTEIDEAINGAIPPGAV